MTDVYKAYAGKPVLSNISLSIDSGEIFGLIGPSGVGKTTLIKAILAQTDIDQGEILLFGKSNRKWNNNGNENIGIMIDSIGCYDRLTCYENLELYCNIYGISSYIVPELLERVGLETSIQKKVSELSKGMRQRLLFSRALLNAPEFIILDEPTSDLDPKTCLCIHSLIRELRQGGTSILITTHNMQEASSLCDTIGLMYQGAFVEYGSPDSICNKYNLKEQICIVDKKGNKETVTNDKHSAGIICEYVKNENIDDIYIVKPDLNQVFIQLTGESSHDNELKTNHHDL